ncbi:hypothetical protein ASPZODRAFT_131120 [Penicilliopsis zonata CBS 506.65]|uniref:L-serine ammonia-lyase n=1 Tax=Penicilliopsis zonata CBS 506.65 TaxID=1073090 RepID=A0A1L9SK89_9EURO|nr:hypothetical protein ASPZODRAFT_131120 [Penicilliopsis zonata CBS 506.65]OJJ47585.1 hypothetical protein ASPZODRAFT_131120 [Penicilliopsis zonata CBS 506.65]
MAHSMKKPWIETPLIESAAFSRAAGCRVFLKLELLQPGGSFKSRAVGNLILSALLNPINEGKKLHFYSSSGGNAGMAAVIAARDLGCPCTVIVPVSTKARVVNKLLEVGAADVIKTGDSWFEADRYLRERFIENQEVSSEPPTTKNIYVPPFDHPDIWDGVGSIIPELARQLPPRERREADDSASAFPADVLVASVGGGGLFNGLICGLDKYLQANCEDVGIEASKVHVVAVETKGTDSLALSLREGSLQSLPAITSLATSLGALCVAPQTLKNARSPPPGIQVTSLVGTDAEAANGVVLLSDELRLQVELACGISVEVAVSKRLKEAVKGLKPDSRVVVIVCGGNNITAEMIAEYRQKLQNGWS